MGLVAEAKRSLDRDAMDLPAPEPRVSVSEAIKITQMNQAAGGRGRGFDMMSLDEQAAQMSEQQADELRERLVMKLRRLRERKIRDHGWTEDKEHDVAIPPGWIRDPNYVAKPRG